MEPFYHPFHHPNYDELPVISLLENNHLLKPNSIEPTIGQVCLPGRAPAGRSSNSIVRLEAENGGLNQVCLRGIEQTVVAVVLLLRVSPPGNFEEQSTIDKIGRRAVNSGAFGVRKITSCWK